MSNENQWNPFLKNKSPSIKDMLPVLCPKCGNSIFDRYYKLFKLEAFSNISEIPQIYNVPVFVCSNCAEVIELTEKKQEETPIIQK